MIYRRAVIAGHNFCLNWIGNKFVLITAKMVVNMSLVWSANKIWSLSARIKHLKRGLLTFLSSTLKRKSFFFVQKEKRKHFYVTMTKWNLSAGVQSYIFLMICSLFSLLSLPFHSYCLLRVLQQKQEARKLWAINCSTIDFYW